MKKIKIVNPNFTQIPNVILDNMPEMTHVELRLILAICRQTFGWHRETTKEMSISFIQNATGLSHTSVINGCFHLAEKGVITRRKCGDSFAYKLVIEMVDGTQTSLEGGSQISLEDPLKLVERGGVKLVETKKETVTKENKESTSCFEEQIPESLKTPEFIAIWKLWYEDRKKRRKPLTALAAKLQLKKLEQIGAKPSIESIENSIRSGWLDIYMPKEQKKQSNPLNRSMIDPSPNVRWKNNGNENY